MVHVSRSTSSLLTEDGVGLRLPRATPKTEQRISIVHPQESDFGYSRIFIWGKRIGEWGRGGGGGGGGAKKANFPPELPW